MAGHINVRWVPFLASVGFSLSALGLAGCAGDDKPDEVPTVEVSSAAPAITVEEATAEASDAIRAWRQATVDLYSSANPDLDDLDGLASGNYLESEKAAIERNLADGWTAIGGRVKLVWARPQDSRLDGDQLSLVIYACIDSTDVQGTDGTGNKVSGAREAVDYSLAGERAEDGAIVWRVTDMTLHPGSKAADSC